MKSGASDKRNMESDQLAEPSEAEWLRALARNPAYSDLADPAEDIYTLEDGMPFVADS